MHAVITGGQVTHRDGTFAVGPQPGRAIPGKRIRAGEFDVFQTRPMVIIEVGAITCTGGAVIVGGEIGNRDRACRNDRQTRGRVTAGIVGAIQHHVICSRVAAGGTDEIAVIQVNSLPPYIIKGGYVAQRDGAPGKDVQAVQAIEVEAIEAAQRYRLGRGGRANPRDQVAIIEISAISTVINCSKVFGSDRAVRIYVQAIAYIPVKSAVVYRNRSGACAFIGSAATKETVIQDSPCTGIIMYVDAREGDVLGGINSQGSTARARHTCDLDIADGDRGIPVNDAQ